MWVILMRDDSKEICVNMEKVERFHPAEDGKCILMFAGSSLRLLDDYETVLNAVSAQPLADLYREE